jgi:hypothetical protein
MLDEEIIPLLQRLRRPTLYTREHTGVSFWQRHQTEDSTLPGDDLK